MPQPIVLPGEDQSELLAVLDRELTRLPEKYRLPVVLCELEGRSRKEAARQLGLPEGTLSSRLAAARKTLAKRMAAHGPAATGASLTALFASEAGAAIVPGPLVASTVRAAGGVVSAGVVALAEGVLKAMLLTKIKSAALVLLLAATVGVGTASLTYRTAAAEPQTKADAPRPSARAASPEKDDLEALRLEVEALRVSLQATREKVKGLEAEVHALKAVPQNVKTELRVEDFLASVMPEATTPVTPPGKNNLPSFGTNVEAKRVEEAAVKAAAAQLMNDPTNKQLQQAANQAIKHAKQALAQLNSPEGKVKAAAAFLMKCPENEGAQDGLRDALEQLNRSTEPKPETPKQ
jgi:hypothetical protein